MQKQPSRPILQKKGVPTCVQNLWKIFPKEFILLIKLQAKNLLNLLKLSSLQVFLRDYD